MGPEPRLEDGSMRRRSTWLAPLSASVGLCATASAQVITPLIVEGDHVGGVGNVTSIERVAVNAAGDWIVLVDTDNSDGEADSVMVRNGVPVAQEGQALASFAGASIDEFDAIDLDVHGHSGWNLLLDVS